MRVIIDVTNIISLPYMTGIQRVVREVTLRMIRNHRVEVLLLLYSETYHDFRIVDTAAFTEYYGGDAAEQDVSLFASATKVFDLDELQPDDIFFDIDSTWNLPFRRSALLPIVKAKGARIASYIYDVIPITHPEVCHEQTIYNFMNYLVAHMIYDDCMIASTQSTIDELQRLSAEMQLPDVHGAVSWLGADFRSGGSEEEVSDEAEAAVQAGRYVLMVGTIEPRKNHDYILDAFDAGLFARDIHLVIVGMMGWNVDALRQRIQKHPELGRKLFYLSGMNDASIDYLYNNAFCVAFPSVDEGFGLPMIEAFQRKTPVLASDIPVLREVGGEYAKYFDLSSSEKFSEALAQWLEDPEAYQKQKELVETYVPVSWDDVTTNIENSLIGMIPACPYEMPQTIRQMVYLTAREDDLLTSLPFVEHHMPFIEEIVICCPDRMIERMEEKYKGGLKVKYLSDTEVLCGEDLPKDHSTRNFLLRCLAMKQDVLDDVFIMSDDDYRPMYPIDLDLFMSQDRYIGYYCYDLDQWQGDVGNPTSFDHCMFRTRDYLQNKGLSCRMFESHMPQAIDRRIFSEMIDEDPSMIHGGYSEWSMYFNYLATKYPSRLELAPYITMAWPGESSAWDMTVYPKRLLFENFYHELYETGAVFEGYSETYHDGICRENAEKTVSFLRSQAKHDEGRAVYQSYLEGYHTEYGEQPTFVIAVAGDTCTLRMPKYVKIYADVFTRVRFRVNSKDSLEDKIELSYAFYDFSGAEMLRGEAVAIPCENGEYEVPIKGTPGRATAALTVSVAYHGKSVQQSARAIVVGDI